MALLLLTPSIITVGQSKTTDTTTHTGVLAGGTMGLHTAKVHPARAEVPVAIEPGTHRVTAQLTASDQAEAGAPTLYVRDPVGEVVARAPGTAPVGLELPWTTIEDRGYGEYRFIVDCGLCSVATYELTLTRHHPGAGVNLTLQDDRLLVDPGRSTTTGYTVTNTGPAPATIEVTAGSQAGPWQVHLSPATVTLDPGASATGSLTVEAEAGLADGTQAALAVTAQAGGATEAVTLHVAHDTGIEALEASSNVVIALIDTGINPYHREFQGPGSAQAHPAWYIEGYPTEARALELTLDAPSYEAAKAADQEVWDQAPGDTLHHVPGTRIIGMRCFGACLGLDEGGHGTGTASLAAGSTLGEAPQAKIVMLSGDIFAAARWAARQPWIDVVSMSLGAWLGGPTVGINEPVSGGMGNPYVPFSFPAAQKAAYERGARWFTGSAQGMGAWTDTNGTTGGAVDVQQGVSGPAPSTYLSPLCGSPWTFVVEAYWPGNEQTWSTQAYPPDVVAQGWDLTAASAGSLAGTNSFGHTSGATPQPAGRYAQIIHQAREILASSQEGAAGGVLAQASPGHPGPATGPLADRQLTVDEAEDVLLHSLEQVDTAESAQEHGTDEATREDSMVTAPGAEYATQGWGLLTDQARAQAMATLVGEHALPLRLEDEAAYQAAFLARLGIWEPHVQGEIWVF